MNMYESSSNKILIYSGLRFKNSETKTISEANLFGCLYFDSILPNLQRPELSEEVSSIELTGGQDLLLIDSLKRLRILIYCFSTRLSLKKLELKNMKNSRTRAHMGKTRRQWNVDLSIKTYLDLRPNNQFILEYCYLR